jgi:hypothetical protein
MKTPKRTRFEAMKFCPILACMIGIGNAQTLYFLPSTHIAIEQASGFVISDFNGDGKPDLLTKNDQYITLRPGNIAGKFASSGKPQALICQPSFLTATDVNSDGIMDLGITAKQNDQEMVCIYLGTSSGIFELAPGSPFKVSNGARFYKPALRFGDLNEDGKIDFVVANERRNTLLICLGDGRGKFALSGNIALEPDRWTYTFALADLDGDQHLDLVTTSGMMVSDAAPGRLFFYQGMGNGTFAEPDHEGWPVPSDPRLALVNDLNSDKYLDLVLVHGRENKLTTLFNDGLGKFSKQVPINIKMTAFTVVATDVNGDKHLDLVASTVDSRNPPHPSRIEILAGDGKGRFHTNETWAIPIAPASYRLAMYDLNQDGKSDLVISSFGSDKLTVLYGR